MLADSRTAAKENRPSRLEVWRRAISRPFTTNVAGFVARSHVHPNIVSGIGLLFSFLAGGAAAVEKFVLAGILLLVSGLFDLLDGAVARASNRKTRFGAVLDSTLDRAGEAALLLGLLIFFIRDGSTWGILLVNISLVTSGLVSYIKARAEGTGLACSVGVFTRAERVVLLAVGMFTGYIIVALAVIAVLSFVTAIQRLLYVWQQLKGKE